MNFSNDKSLVFTSDPAPDDENPQWSFSSELLYSTTYDALNKEYIEIVRFLNLSNIAH